MRSSAQQSHAASHVYHSLLLGGARRLHHVAQLIQALNTRIHPEEAPGPCETVLSAAYAPTHAIEPLPPQRQHLFSGFAPATPRCSLSRHHHRDRPVVCAAKPVSRLSGPRRVLRTPRAASDRLNGRPYRGRLSYAVLLASVVSHPLQGCALPSVAFSCRVINRLFI
jgi:hypothetical protein